MHEIRNAALAVLTALAAVAAQGADHYGAPMPEAGTPLSLGEAIARADAAGRYEGKIRGRITEVCRKKGCFMVLTDADHYARVTFLDYGFFVPSDTPAGMTTVYGELTRGTLTAEEAHHSAADAGRAGEATGPRGEYGVVASAVVIE